MGLSDLNLSSFEESIQKNEDIRGVMYTGSVGKGLDDKFSDLDIELVVNKRFLSNSKKNIKILLTTLGKIKLLYYLDDKNVKSLVNDYQKVDFKLHTIGNLVPREKYSKIKIIKDTKNLLANLTNNSKKCKTEVNKEFIEREFKEAIITQIVAANRCGRGWKWSAMEWVNFRVERLFVDLMKIRGKLQFGFTNVENSLNKKEMKMLKDSYCKEPSNKEIERSLKSLWKFTIYVFRKYEKESNKKLFHIDEKSFLKKVSSLLKEST